MGEDKKGEIQGYGDKERKESACITDTVQLPGVEGQYIHIETSKEAVARSFSEYAQKMGLNEEVALNFFQRNVDFYFGDASKADFEYPNFADRLLSKSIQKINSSNPLACVVPHEDGKIILCVDTQKIATFLPRFRSKKIYDAGDYGQMTDEERIASFQQAIETATEHEFWHIFQQMDEKDRFKRYYSKSLLQQRLLGAYILVTPAMEAIDELRPLAIPTSVVLGCAIVLLGKDGGWVEADAVSAQRKALKMELKSPYTFTPEKISTTTPNLN